MRVGGQSASPSYSVSIRVRKEVVCLHPNLEFWTYTIANGDYTDNLGRFGHIFRT